MQYIYLSSPNENTKSEEMEPDEPGFQSLQRVSQLGRKFYIIYYLLV
jgi:hypothetical protein